MTGDYLLNVKRDFKAVGDGRADDSVAIQNAMQATSGNSAGGRLIFPRGRYLITNPLLTPGGYYSSIVLEGEGGMPGNTGSCIIGNFNDWLLKNTVQTNFPQQSIINLNFQQNYQGGKLGPDTDNTAGCVNWGAGLGGYILGCNFDIWTGVAVYAQVDCIEIIGCNITGHWGRMTGDPSFDSVGFWTSGRVSGGKHTNLTYGAVITDSGKLENMMLDTCSHGVSIGSAPMAWKRNPMEDGTMMPTGWSFTSKSVTLSAVSHESCLISMYVGRAGKVYVEGGEMANYVTEPNGPTAFAGIMIDDFCDRSVFRGIGISGAFTGGAVLLGSQYGQGRAAGTRFIDVNAQNTAGKRWAFKDGDISTRIMPADSTADDPIVFEGCPWMDPAIKVDQLPSSPSSDWLQVVSDSMDPVWTGSASNVGKPVRGGGSKRAHVRWDNENWVIAG